MSLQSLLAAQHPELPGIEPSTPTQRTNWKNDGKAFEKEIERTAGGYGSRRIANFRKVDPPTRIIYKFDEETKAKRSIVIFMQNPFLDFAGVWTAHGGRALFVECKSTATHRLPFKRSGGLTDDQLASIRTWRLAGAAVAVLWQWAGRVVIFTPEMLVVAEGRGDKSLTFEEGIPVARGEGTIVWDFLGTLEKKLWPDCST